MRETERGERGRCEEKEKGGGREGEKEQGEVREELRRCGMR